MRPELPTGTVTFLFTDIEGSTRLLHTLGADGYADALAEHRRVLREAFAAHGGVEVDTQGDAFFVAFPTAPGAVAAAEAGQRALDAGPICVRMGLHTGAPTPTPEGYVGADVHHGARIAALAHGGQVLLSETTASLLADGDPLTDLGRHRLKDFDGPARLHQLGVASFPPLRSPGTVDLPTPATPFLGREHELHDALSIVLGLDPAILTILGPGGTGKTRFTIELARLLAEEADGGTVFVQLASLRDTSLVLPAIAEAIGAEAPDLASVAARIGGKRTHVLLDNLEQLLPETAPVLASLAAAAPQLRLLVTSREALRVAAEHRFDLPPLSHHDAIAFFLARARAVRPRIDGSPAIAALCNRLDRLPLALELAAARTRILAPDALLERLSTRLDLPAPRDADARHATLRATIEWSYDLLRPDEQQLFARLSIFPGGGTLEALEHVCETDLETVASILDKSLLRVRPDAGGDRFWMLETIREFAASRLADTDESSLRRRQVASLLATAARAGAGSLMERRNVTWEFDLVEPELDNVRSALTWAADHDPALGLELACALEAYWVVRAPEEGAAWLEQLLELGADAGPRVRANASRALAGSYDIVGDPERAAPLYRSSLALFEELDDDLHVANLRFRIASNMINRGRVDEALTLLADARDEFGRLGHIAGEAEVLGYLGFVAARSSDFETAAERFEQSAELARGLGWSWWESNMLTNLASIERRLGRLDAAESKAQRAVRLSVALGDRMGAVFACAELASIAAAGGDAATAGRLWGAIDAEADDAPIAQWAAERDDYLAIVETVAGADFESAREEGRLMSIQRAVGAGETQTEP